MNGYTEYKIEEKMTRILEVRYTDLEEEKKLSSELLAWALEHKNIYAKVFALTYLGDYYISLCDVITAGTYLLEAKEILKEYKDISELNPRLYTLLGIYYDMKVDEQNAIEYYLKATTEADKQGDKMSRSVALNNLAFIFQRHGRYEEALQYYLEVKELLTEIVSSPFEAVLEGSIAEVYLLLGKHQDAKKHIIACQNSNSDPIRGTVLSYKNWCGYYTAIGENEKAKKFADLFFEKRDVMDKDSLTAFEHYNMLFKNMMKLVDSKRAKCFLKAMEEVCLRDGLDRNKTLEESKILYAIEFESDQIKRGAYYRFYKKNQEFRSKVTETITSAMKSQIYLWEYVAQTEQMHSEQASLEWEVKEDELTSIPNRRFFETMMRKDVVNQENRGIIILDADYFKEYNDFYGHLMGDEVLKEVAKCLKENAKEGVYPCRYGGDEFVCICKGFTVIEIEDYINNVRISLHNKALCHEKSHCSNEVTLSIGYALAEQKTEVELRELFQLADQALYKSKRCGRNTYTRSKVDVL